MRRPGLAALAVLALLVLPGAAQAHLVTSGLGPFYDGALHLLLSPAGLLGLAAAALLAGLRGREAARLTVITLPIAWLLGGVIGLLHPVTQDLAWLSVLSFIVLGGLVAADAALRPVSVASLAGLYAGFQGLSDGSALAAAGAGGVGLLGVVLAVLLLALFISALVVSLQRFWARVAVRVAGSWVAAIGMLMLGWLSHGVA